MYRNIIQSFVSIFSDRAFTLYTYLMTVVLTLWLFISFFTRDINQSISTLVVFAMIAGILHYLDMKMKKRQSILFIFLEFTVYPAFIAVAFIVLLIINANLLLMPKDLLNIIAIITLLISVSVISYFTVRSRRMDDYYLKMIRVVLDYAEVVYWIVFSVILFLFVNDSSESHLNSALLDSETSKIIKLFILPFMIQTRFIKAYIGYHLQKIEIKKIRVTRSKL
jgi:hypothetical protein